MTEDATQEYATAVTDPGPVNFASGDVLTVALTQTKGNQAVTLRYDGPTGSDADSRLVHPDELVAISVTDAATLAETVAAGLGLTRADSATLADSVGNAVGIGITDVASLLESVASVAGKGFFPSDPAGVMDSIVYGLGFTRTDSAVLAESVGSLQGKRIFDALALVDVVVRPTGGNISFADVASILESAAGVLGFTGTEVASLAESMQTTLRPGVADTVSFLEFISVVTGGNYLLDDMTGAFESLSAALGVARTETATVTETIDTLLGRVLFDTPRILESIGIVTGRGFFGTDTAGVLDSLVSGFGFSGTETTSVAESIRGSIGVGVSDPATLFDSLAIVTGQGFSISEASGIVASIGAALGFARADASQIADTIQSAFGVGISDPATVNDLIAIFTAQGFSIGESTGVGDSIGSKFGFSEVDTATLAQSVRSALGLSISDAARIVQDAVATGLPIVDVADLEAIGQVGLRASDLTGLIDSIATTLGLTPTDIGTLLDSIAAATTSSRVDTVDVTETLLSALAFGADEAHILLESLRGALSMAASDGASFVESASTLAAFSRSEASTLVGAITSAVRLTQTDPVRLMEVVQGATNMRADAAALLGATAALGLSSGDATTVGATVGVSLSAADSANIVLESIRRALGLGESDAATVLETVAVGAGMSRRDVAGVIESIAAAAALARVDASRVAESIVGGIGFKRADVHSVAESIAAAARLSPRDSASIAESIAAAARQSRRDSASLVESIVRGVGFVRADVHSVAESIAAAARLSPRDPAGIAESISAAAHLSRGDAASVVASLVGGVGFVRGDVPSVVESIMAAARLSPADAVGVIESIATAARLSRADAAGVVESIAAAAGFSRADAAGLAESIIAVARLARNDMAAVAESIVAAADLSRADTAGVAESVQGASGTGISAAALIKTTASLGVFPSDAASLETVLVVGFSPVDVTSQRESAQSVVGAGVFQPTSFLDSLRAVARFSRTEATTLMDSVDVVQGRRVFYMSKFLDSIASAVGLSFVDTPNMAESIRGNLGNGSQAAVTFSDTVTFAYVSKKGILAVAAAETPDPVFVGDILTYTLDVTNVGSRLATGVVVRDRLPAAVIYRLATASRGSCSSGSGTVTCNLGNLAGGASAGVTVSVVPTADAGGTTITNYVIVTSREAGPEAVDTSASQVTAVRKLADLEVEMSVPPNGVVAGKRLTYRLTVINHGPSEASRVALIDTLPNGVAFVSSASDSGRCDEATGKLTCVLGTVTSGSEVTVSAVVDVVGSLAPGETRTLTNIVSVSAEEADLDKSNNLATVSTRVLQDGDLDGIGDLVEDAGPDGGDGDGDGVPDSLQENVASFQNVIDQRYVTVKSLEGSALVGVRAIDNPSPVDAPTGVDFPVGFLAYRVTQLAPAASTTVVISFPEGTIGASYWKYGATPDALPPHWYEFLYDGSTGAEIDGDTVILHFVDGERGDHDLKANGEIVDPGGSVFAPADLSVTMSDVPDTVLVGNTLAYTVTVQNRGPSNANGVVASATLPPGVVFTSATPDQGGCNQKLGTVTCDLGAIDSGAGARVTIAVTPVAPTGGTTINNTVSVAANETDSDNSNNSATLSTSVVRNSDIFVTTRAAPDPVRVGDVLTYAVTVTNNGPSQSTGVVLSIALPPGTSFGSAVASQGNCAQVLDTVTCALGALDSGASATVAVSVVLPAAAGGTTVTHTAVVTANELDPTPGNNSAIGRTLVVAPTAVLVATPGPAPAPQAPTPTPFPALVVVRDERITRPMAREGCSIEVVQPTESATISLPEHGVSLYVPAPAQQATFQVRLCALDIESLQVLPRGRVLGAVSIEALDVDARPLGSVRLWSSARLTVTPTDAEIQELGGIAAAFIEHVSGRLGLQKFRPSATGGSWFKLLTSFSVPDRSLSSEVPELDQTFAYALVWWLEQPTAAPSPTPAVEATPTPTPTSSPALATTAPASPTPVPAATATASPTPVPAPAATVTVSATASPAPRTPTTVPAAPSPGGIASPAPPAAAARTPTATPTATMTPVSFATPEPPGKVAATPERPSTPTLTPTPMATPTRPPIAAAAPTTVVPSPTIVAPTSTPTRSAEARPGMSIDTIIAVIALTAIAGVGLGLAAGNYVSRRGLLPPTSR